MVYYTKKKKLILQTFFKIHGVFETVVRRNIWMPGPTIPISRLRFCCFCMPNSNPLFYVMIIPSTIIPSPRAW